MPDPCISVLPRLRVTLAAQVGVRLSVRVRIPGVGEADGGGEVKPVGRVWWEVGRGAWELAVEFEFAWWWW